MAEIGRLFLLIGAVCVAVGLVLTLAPKIPWLGRLPGDLTYESERVRIYFPLATCLLVSIALSALLFWLRR